MTADFVAATSGQANTAANSVSVPWASTTAGDLCLLALNIGGLSTITDPTGWTAVDNLDESTTLRTKLWWHRCDGTESGSLTVAWGGTAQVAAAGMAAWRGIYDAASPIDAHSVIGNTSVATSRATAGATSTGATVLQVCIYCDGQATAAQSWTPPAGCHELLDLSTTTTTFLGMEIIDAAALASTSALPAKTAVSAQSGTAFVGFNVGLRIKVSSTPTDPADGGAFVPPAHATATVDEAFDGSGGGGVSWPTYGQGWPRIKQG